MSQTLQEVWKIRLRDYTAKYEAPDPTMELGGSVKTNYQHHRTRSSQYT